VFTCALIVVLSAIAIPSLTAARERDAAVMAARFLATKVSLLRADAVRRNRAIAVRFDPDTLGRFGIFADGDGDGVLQSDINSGVDQRLEFDAHLRDVFALVSVAVTTDVPAPDGNGVIVGGSDPIRIGNSNFLSLTPLGTATSGTIYLASADTQVCVRVFGPTGRVRVLRFDRASHIWRED
jgi:Tfp pilus assembly protein FimT